MLLGISNIDLPTHIDPLVKNTGKFFISFSKDKLNKVFSRDFILLLVRHRLKTS